jgi:hypothetical protein
LVVVVVSLSIIYKMRKNGGRSINYVDFRMIVNIFYIFINKLTIQYDTLERSVTRTIWRRSNIFINKLTIQYDTLERSVTRTIWRRSVAATPSPIYFRRRLYP